MLVSSDVISTLDCLKKLGVKIKSKKFLEIIGLGLNGFKYKNNLVLDAGNSGTLGRLILGLLIHSKVKLKGDKSLSKEIFKVIKPLEKFGAKFNSNYGKLPIKVQGTDYSKPIKYYEKKDQHNVKVQ